MLYDILIIDDDFDSNKDFDSSKGPKNAIYLLLELLRENLRVTWSTGEKNDVEKLKEKDLSCIKFIFLDLHLTGITEQSSYGMINGKIMGIFQEIDKYIKSKKIICYINSDYFNNELYGKTGKNDLEKKLEDMNPNKYYIEVIDEKNNLKNEKNNLHENNINILSKSLIINKSIEIEKIFDDQLEIDEKLRDVITFENKYKKYRNLKGDILNSDCKKRIQLLQEIRNKLAHTKGDKENLKEIKDNEKKKTFWKIIKGKKGKEITNEIDFKNFDSLIKYIDSIDELRDNLKKL